MTWSGQTVVVLGTMGQIPFAGVAWQVLHYLEGLRRLGHDVYYVEDTGAWPYDPARDTITDNSAYAVRFIKLMLERCSLVDRFAYCTPEPRRTVLGMSEEQLSHLYRRADTLINLTGATVLREEHLPVPRRIYLETDPVLPQIQVAQRRSLTIELLDAHTDHLTFAENLGAPDCGVPVERFRYRTTRQPVVLDWWWDGGAGGSRGRPQGSPYTTVASWRQDGKDVEWNGAIYHWSKHLEFLKVIDLPERVDDPLELALACADPEAVRLLTSHRWRVVDGIALSRDLDPYRSYIQESAGELTVAKDQNIRLRSGWFSDRSACYLAAGRPVVTQDTAFGKVLPSNQGGLYSFRTIDDIVAALDGIASDYHANSMAAREIAREYFDSERVLRAMMA